MNNWIPNNKIVKFAAITALLSIVLYFSGLFIVFNETKGIENAYHSTESDAYKENEVGAIKSITDTNKESIQILQNFFLQKGDEAKFIEQIENAAKTSGIKFETSSIDVALSGSNSFEEDVDVTINVEGSWDDTMSFVDKLGKMPFGISVDNVSLTANTPGKWTGFVELVVFRQK
jgi:Tfp pilus assembly protein PilO